MPERKKDHKQLIFTVNSELWKRLGKGHKKVVLQFYAMRKKKFSHKKATFYTVLHERLKVEGFCASKLEFFYSESVDILGPYKLFYKAKKSKLSSPQDDLIFEEYLQSPLRC